MGQHQQILTYGMPFAAAALMTAAFTPLVMMLAHRIGAVDRGGYRKVYQGAMPLMGGLGVATPLLLAWLAAFAGGHFIYENWADVYRYLQQNTGHPHRLFDLAMRVASMRTNAGVMLLGALGVIALGILDDARGMRARYKLAGQVLVACWVCFAGNHVSAVSIPLYGPVHFSYEVSIFITVLWITGLINAFNLIDGLDGLATGIGLIAALSLGALGILGGNVFLAVVSFVLAGSLLAFLFFNFHPARIFLGDTGSMFLGYVLATVTVMNTYRAEATAIVVAPLLALSFPIFETFISILRRFIRGAPIFVGDGHHTHHRLLRMGYSQRRVVLMLYAVAAALAGSAVSAQLLPDESRWSWLPVAAAVLTLMAIAWLAGYLRTTRWKTAVMKRERNTLLRALSRYAGLSLNRSKTRQDRDFLMDCCRREMGLVFLDAWFEATETPLGSSGRRISAAESPTGFDTVERVRINTSNGHTIIAHFQFAEKPDEIDLRDIMACIAQVFENTTLRPPKQPPQTQSGRAARGERIELP